MFRTLKIGSIPRGGQVGRWAGGSCGETGSFADLQVQGLGSGRGFQNKMAGCARAIKVNDQKDPFIHWGE